jgi:hypothetical protein
MAAFGVAHSVSVMFTKGLSIGRLSGWLRSARHWVWSNIESGQHHQSRSHVHGSVGGSNRSCLTVVSVQRRGACGPLAVAMWAAWATTT